MQDLANLDPEVYQLLSDDGKRQLLKKSLKYLRTIDFMERNSNELITATNMIEATLREILSNFTQYQLTSHFQLSRSFKNETPIHPSPINQQSRLKF